jgi:uncharacterized repeat protein (TIGR03837 family)
LNWDIFCRVVDNYGDVGVCWRLARQLVADHGISVRLSVNDLAAFARLSPAIDTALDTQSLAGIDVRRWCEAFPDVPLGDVVIEAFGCEIPERFKDAMAAKSPPSAWINLEYLSAEKWVSGTHGLPSPQPKLTKYFFFPGFVEQTGGLLRERGLLDRRDRFQRDSTAMQAFWQSLGLALPQKNELRISLFCYENPALNQLLQQWSEVDVPVTCLVPVGVAANALSVFFGAPPEVNQTFSRGNLTARIIPFLEHERYDYLLWACDVNFVRGEDSFVRAQWAARPFVWQIYPQNDDAHRIKLDAFLDLFCADLDADCACRVRSFWQGWNGDGLAPTHWRELTESRTDIASQASRWSEKLAQQPDLATALVNFTNDLLKYRVST